MDAIHLSRLVPIETAVPLFGYVVPPMAFVILLMNVLLVLTLCRRHMRSPVNALMVGMATMNTVAITVPVPAFVYFFSSGNVYRYVPFSWCRTYFTTVYILPLTSNMASIWLTVALACVRCLSVWRPLAARSLITWYRTNFVVLVIVLISFSLYFPSLFEYTFDPVNIALNETTITHDDDTIVGCRVEKSFAHLNETFCEAHTWLQIMMTSLIPWFCILFPDAGLLWRLKRAEVKRNALLSGKESNIDGRKQDIGEKIVFINQHLKFKQRRQKITWRIFINVTIIWLVEIPFAVVFFRILIREDFDLMRSNIENAGVFVILMKYITYPMIFIMYCIMSERFRQTFKDVALCRATAAKTLLITNKSGSTQNTERDSAHLDSSKRQLSSANGPRNDRKMSL